MISWGEPGVWPFSARWMRIRWTDSVMFSHEPLNGVYSGSTPWANSHLTKARVLWPARLSMISRSRSGGRSALNRGLMVSPACQRSQLARLSASGNTGAGGRLARMVSNCCLSQAWKTALEQMLILFHPCTGTVRVKGVRSCSNAVLHAWLKQQLLTILASLPPAPVLPEADNRANWERWQAGLTIKPLLSADLPPLRLLLIMDNLAGHKTRAFVEWLCAHGVLPLYTPLSGSWLNMTESVQRILIHRAL